MDRFWSKVVKTEGCWIWTGALNSGRYGSFRLDGKVRLAHHVAHELLIGALPSLPGYHKTLMMHVCDNRQCVRPHADHARPATQRENMIDAGGKGRMGKADVRGEKNPAHRWSDEQIAEMRERYATGETQTAIALRFGTSQAVVSLIVNFKRRAA